VWMFVAIGALLLAAAGGAGSYFFYAQVKSLEGKVTTLLGSGNVATTKVADLESQLAKLSKTADDLNAQIVALTAANKELTDDLLFFVAPPGTPSPAPQTSVIVKGGLASGALYSVTMQNGIKVFVENSKNAKVDAALKPLIGADVQLAGTHAVGSAMLT